jgi:flagellum-specific ATP synthase
VIDEFPRLVDPRTGGPLLDRTVLVVNTSNMPVAAREASIYTGATIAEYFRDLGLDVLLVMDSLTRVAMAQREIGLAIGEPPATKGYPPSVFAKLPQLAERAGNGKAGGGSITAFFTVLMEGDDQQDPIADAARAILDGHIVLTRDLADAGHYPAIDVEASISRAQPDLVNDDELETIRHFRYLYSRYMRSRDLLAVGAYVPGADVVLDQAMKLYPHMQRYLMQGMNERVDMAQSRSELAGVLG